MMTIFQNYIETAVGLFVTEAESDCEFMTGGPNTAEEVHREVKGLGSYRAPGFDRISNENLKYSGPKLIVVYR